MKSETDHTKKPTGKSCIGSCLGFAGSSTLVILLILGFIIGGYFLLRAMGAYLVTADTLERADAIVVLSGGGLPRIEQGVELFNERYADWIILTETGQVDPTFGLDTTDMSKMDTILMGIPSRAILITQIDADSTYKEAIAVRNLLQQHRLSSCIVVTDPYHTRRARIVFKDVVEKEGIKVLIYPVNGSWYQPGRWFLSINGWEATIREYIKLIAYTIFYSD